VIAPLRTSATAPAAEAELRKSLAAAERLNEPLLIACAKTYLARLLAHSAPAAELDEPAQLALVALGRAWLGDAAVTPSNLR
jgi:hypothetical protein